MSLSVFKEFDKPAADIFSDDFDSKYTLKIKSAGPFDTTFTTNTQFCAKEGKLVPKLTAKWTHPSGFTVDKLEIASDGRVAIESSLTGVTKGLKLEFKGNDSDKGDLAFEYSLPSATVTGECDINNLSSARASVLGGHGAFTFGGAVELKIAKSTIDSSTFALGLGYTAPKQFFVGLRACKNLAHYSGLFSYSAIKDTILAASVSHSTKETSAVVAAVYKCCPNTTIKVKASSAGVLNASVKQALEKKFTVVASAEVPSSLNGVKFGLNATLG